MRTILALTLLGFVLSSCGQDKVTFKRFFKPNKVYRATMTTSSETEVNFTGNQERIDKIKTNGTKLPIIISGSSESTTTTTTGTLTTEQTFPARMVFEKAVTTQKQNDKESKEDNSMSGLIIEGFYENGNRLKIDTMISATMDDDTKAMIKSTLEKVQEKITFPESPMKVGDTFKQEMPMQIPMAGLNPIQLIIITNYELTEIKNNKATFDFTQNVTLDISSKQSNVSATGEGKGISEFDITNNATTKYESDLTMIMTTTANDLVISAKINSKSKQVVTIE
jgi:hypothetical protein